MGDGRSMRARWFWRLMQRVRIWVNASKCMDTKEHELDIHIAKSFFHLVPTNLPLLHTLDSPSALLLSRNNLSLLTQASKTHFVQKLPGQRNTCDIQHVGSLQNLPLYLGRIELESFPWFFLSHTLDNCLSLVDETVAIPAWQRVI